MNYTDVCIESLGYTLPDEIRTTAQIEEELQPLYQRLKLPEGRLELMTGIRERRFWPHGTRPSALSVNSCRLALDAAEFSANDVGCLIHGSVCRDFLEPATAATVHNRVGLPSHCMIYDVSNACLGIMNGMIQAANMIQLGQIKSALVVGSEVGRHLVENTISQLNSDMSLTRKSVKPAIASLTIGSASCAVLLTHKSISQTGNHLVGAAVTANTEYCDLCQSQQDQAGSEMQPLMDTDSEKLLQMGIATGVATLQPFFDATGWTNSDIDRTICHQVGIAHRKLMLDSLGFSETIDYMTFPRLGNTGSAALPVTFAESIKEDFVQPNQNVALLGIGSGINCLMIGVNWQTSKVRSSVWNESTAAQV